MSPLHPVRGNEAGHQTLTPDLRGRSALAHSEDLPSARNELLRIERLPDHTARTLCCRGSKRRRIKLTAEQDHGNRPVELLHPTQHLPTVDARHHHIEQDKVGRRFLDQTESLNPTLSFPNHVTLNLKADPKELPHTAVVVDDQHLRLDGDLTMRRPGLRYKPVEIVPPISAMPARRIERRNTPDIRPLSDRRLRDSKELRRLAQRKTIWLPPPAPRFVFPGGIKLIAV